ncbi:hypothetical protein, partial [Hymenobacter glacialis]|uniref:hypothetical protein n=1 Tax=Hymenobacter glacialis TaxID=1908236 RepID=UPI0013015898
LKQLSQFIDKYPNFRNEKIGHGFSFDDDIANYLDLRESIAKSILKPSIGTIVSIIRQLDIDNEFFGNKRLKQLSQFIDKYPNFRNEKIGHGFSFDDDIANY